MRKKILIIGGTGFIGKNLILRLKNKNFKIFSLSKKLNYSFFKRKNIKQISCDITKIKDIEKKLKKENFDYIVNLGGYIDHKKKIKTILTHFNGVKNLVKFFEKKKFKLFIQIGTSLEYGNVKSPQIESNNCTPKSNYGLAKLNASKIFFKINEKKFFPFVILRLYQVYGPYQKDLRLLPFVIKSCLASKKFKTTSGNQYRDFVHVDDLNDLIIKIINSNIKNEIFNVGSGKPIKIRKLIKKINKIIGKGKPIFGGLNMRKDESFNLFPNIKKVKKFFPWKPKIDLDSGLKKTIKYYKKEIS